MSHHVPLTYTHCCWCWRPLGVTFKTLWRPGSGTLLYHEDCWDEAGDPTTEIPLAVVIGGLFGGQRCAQSDGGSDDS